MLRNYITTAIRNFSRNLSFSLINVIGLSLGLAGSFVIGSWVWQELNYDKHFKDYERIYRTSVSFYSSGVFARGPEILNETLTKEASEVELATRLHSGKLSDIKVGVAIFKETPFYADSNFFKVFSYDFIAGNRNTALSSPNNVVITSDLAQKIFGEIDVLGKPLDLSETTYLVSGIVESTKNNLTHISAELWFPEQFQNDQNWISAKCFNYIKLKKGFDYTHLVERLESFKQNHVYPKFNEDTPYNQWKNSGKYDFHTSSLSDIHLNPAIRFDMKTGGNRANVYVFLIISAFLILIATINFVNLSTAQSVKRAKEVGIRKALGTSRKNLIVQYLLESISLSLVSLILGVGLAEVFLILFQNFTNESLVNGLFHHWMQMASYLSLGIIVGALAGIYPAFYLSHYRPIDVLKQHVIKGKNSRFRNSLVILQFTISTALIICSLLVYNQIQHLRIADLGFNRENVLIVNNFSVLENSKDFFKDRLLQYGEVSSISTNKRVPSGSSVWVYNFQSEAMEQGLGFQTFPVDDQYLETLGFRLIKGRNFSKDIASDSSAVILTESAVQELLLEEPIIGTQLDPEVHVIGVVSDFSYNNFHEKADPAVFTYSQDGYRLSVKLSGRRTQEFIGYMEKEWLSLSPDQPLNYSFIDENFEKLIQKDKTLAKTISFFTIIAIFISCLGLLGLAAFTAQQRQKEIGIRKVLGASVTSVVILLNKSFTKLVLFSILLAIPISSYVIDQWLQNFQYKIDPGFFIYITAGISAMIISWLTVSLLSFRAASVNPVESLRDE